MRVHLHCHCCTTRGLCDWGYILSPSLTLSSFWSSLPSCPSSRLMASFTFSFLRNLARRFWNQTCKQKCRGARYPLAPAPAQAPAPAPAALQVFLCSEVDWRSTMKHGAQSWVPVVFLAQPSGGTVQHSEGKAQACAGDRSHSCSKPSYRHVYEKLALQRISRDDFV